MFFRKKKNKVNSDPDSKLCESKECPTPKNLLPKGMYFELEGAILCQFCYTKALSEKPVEENFERPKTKKVEQVALNRIAPKSTQWDLSSSATSHLQRIGPSNQSDKYTEELSKWKDILNAAEMPNRFTNVTNLIKLNNTVQARILEMSVGFVLVSFSSKKDLESKKEEEIIQQQIFSSTIPEPVLFKMTDFGEPIQNWISENVLLDNSDKKNDLFLRYRIIEKATVVSLENLDTNPYLSDLHTLLFELGRFFYFINFLGYEDATQLAIIIEEETIKFVNLSQQLSTKTFADLPMALQQLYAQIPFVLDEQYFESFIGGATKQQQILQNILENDSKVKDLILNFFEQNNIEFEEHNPLPSIKVFL